MERALEDPGVTDSDAPVTVVVVDDQSAVREGLVLLLGTLSGVTVAGQAADGDAAVALVAATSPQVVLMDLNMPGCDGVTATRRITAEHPSTRVVVLTTYADDESIIGALQAGALGYLTKDATRAEIGRAILAAADGQAVLDPGVQRRLLVGRHPDAAAAPCRRSAAAAASGDPGGVDDLTPREADVLRLIAAGAVQPGDRQDPVRQRGDGQDPRQPHLRQDRLPRPGPGDALRLHPRIRHAELSKPIPGC